MHYDANAVFNEQKEGTVHRAQFGPFTQPFLRAHAIGNLWALSYAARKTLVFDAGFNKGLTGTATRWAGFVGFTYLLPRRLS